MERTEFEEKIQGEWQREDTGAEIMFDEALVHYSHADGTFSAYNWAWEKAADSSAHNLLTIRDKKYPCALNMNATGTFLTLKDKSGWKSFRKI